MTVKQIPIYRIDIRAHLYTPFGVVRNVRSVSTSIRSVNCFTNLDQNEGAFFAEENFGLGNIFNIIATNVC